MQTRETLYSTKFLVVEAGKSTLRELTVWKIAHPGTQYQHKSRFLNTNYPSTSCEIRPWQLITVRKWNGLDIAKARRGSLLNSFYQARKYCIALRWHHCTSAALIAKNKYWPAPHIRWALHLAKVAQSARNRLPTEKCNESKDVPSDSKQALTRTFNQGVVFSVDEIWPAHPDHPEMIPYKFDASQLIRWRQACGEIDAKTCK